MSNVALRPMTREEFHRAIDAGVYPDFERLELLEGQVFRRMTHKPPHAGTIDVICAWLRAVLPSNHFVRVQLPIALDSFTEPEPDIALIEGQPREFLAEHPLPARLRLVVEVADRSLSFDLQVKSALYAKAGIPEYWMVDLQRQQILVHQEPEGEAYRMRATHRHEDSFSTSWNPEVVVAVSDLLP